MVIAVAGGEEAEETWSRGTELDKVVSGQRLGSCVHRRQAPMFGVPYSHHSDMSVTII